MKEKPLDKAAETDEPAGDALRADLEALRNDLDALAGDVAALGRNQARRLKVGAEDLLAAGEGKMREMDDSLSSTVHANPVRSLAIAFLAGYVFAAIAR